MRKDKGKPHARYWTAEKVRMAYALWEQTHDGRRPRQRDLRYEYTLPGYTTVYKLFGGIDIDTAKG